MTTRAVSVTRDIRATPEQVFAILADAAKHPLIDGSGTVVAERTGTTSRLGPGTKFSMAMKMGLPYRVTNTVVEFEEARLIAWRHFGGHRWRWQLEPDGDGTTRVTETFDWSTSIAPRLLERRHFPERNKASMVATLDRLERLFADAT